MDLIECLANKNFKKKQRNIFIETLDSSQISKIAEIVQSFFSSKVGLKKTQIETLARCYRKIERLKSESTNLEKKRKVLQSISLKLWDIILRKTNK